MLTTLALTRTRAFPGDGEQSIFSAPQLKAIRESPLIGANRRKMNS
jgi:hypothetical protein